jgi:assimilatory nitrate reductase catalytic subunit
MSSAVAGYKQTLGADAPPACYEDIDHADCLFIVGSNTAYGRIRSCSAASRMRGAPTEHEDRSSADPRRTDTAEIADLFLPIQPGTDVMLFNGMLHLMLWEGWTMPLTSRATPKASTS